MPWNTPITFTPGQVVSATDLNNNVRDNANYLLSGRALAKVVRTGARNYSTTGFTFVDVDATNLILNLTVNSGRVLCIATGAWYNAAGTVIDLYMDWILDSVTRAGGAQGSLRVQTTTTNFPFQPFICVAQFSGLSVGSHTFKLQFAASAGNTVSIANASYPIVLHAFEI
ncbi:MAG: hypothetical protein ABI947_06505 [Chloroflexota bacterium]